MKLWRDKTLLSASDLMRFMGCRHASALDLAFAGGADLQPADDSDDMALLQAQGDAHEAAYLEQLKQTARTVVEIPTAKLSLADAANRTKQVLAEGPEYVFQGAFLSSPWGGYTDFLVRVERPSALGSFSYEVIDTKLKRSPDPKHVLQLVLYSDLLSEVQGQTPELAHLVLGTGEKVTLRLSDYSAYARHAKRRLEAFVAAPEKTRPEPVNACDLCRWRELCNAEWEASDSLSLVAGISRSQRHKLEAAGVFTMAELGQHEQRVPKLAQLTLDRLRVQARLQTARRTGGEPHFELRALEVGRGLLRLPQPDPGDLFFDIEGDPFFEGGLEYLHGLWFNDGGQSVYQDYWAHDRQEEGQALTQLLAFFVDRLRQFPTAHIYHYAPYEVTALRRLASLHGVGEAALDQLLREERFVDLYAVVSGALITSEPGYSIKNMEAFYMDKRAGDVVSAGGSIVAYEKWRETGDELILQEIRDYNKVDCISTQMLRDWLIQDVRPEGLPWKEQTGGFAAAEIEEEDEMAAALRNRLDGTRKRLGEPLADLLFDLSYFHKREAKPAWWAVFDRLGRDSEELVDDLESLGGLEAVGPAERFKRSQDRLYRFPDQETKLKRGSSVNLKPADVPIGLTLVELDREENTAQVRFGPTKGDPPDRIDLLPAGPIKTAVLEQAVARFVESMIAGDDHYIAARDLLCKTPPRFQDAERPATIVPDGEDLVTAVVGAISDLDNSVLPIQGPPGTGKTYVSSQAILNLVQQGKRVAVTSNSHKAIDNLLFAILDRAIEADAEIKIAKKIGETIDGAHGERITQVTGNDDPALFEADVIGGTAWLFSRPEFDQMFDHLFVDEAGQVSLANIVAMGTAARNIVLVGDPMQLPQVIQGSHPGAAGLSALEHLLAGHDTVPPERGIFLPVSRRMHPDICGFISEQVYEGRLSSDAGAARQALSGLSGLPVSGAHLVEVTHHGNSQTSAEEITAIKQALDRLVGSTFRDRDGLERKLTLADIVIVAPYNAQVNALMASLPRDARVGTVDRFQGQEAPVCLVSMTTSSADELPRDVNFLFSLNRINVAVSRAQVLSLVFASPRLLEVPCRSIEEMRLVNALCALREWGGKA